MLKFEECTLKGVVGKDANSDRMISEYVSCAEGTAYEKIINNKSSLNKSYYFNLYKRICETENLKFVRAVYNGEIVGFSVIEIYQHPHFDYLLAMQNSLFMMKEFRVNGNGSLLIDFTAMIAKAYGAKGLVLTAPFGSRLERVFQRHYRQTDSVFMREL